MLFSEREIVYSSSSRENSVIIIGNEGQNVLLFYFECLHCDWMLCEWLQVDERMLSFTTLIMFPNTIN